jgi:hypothetical protein
MRFDHALSTEHIRAVFQEEITSHQGTVTDTFDDGTRVFLRSVLPLHAEVAPGDKLQGGVALKANEQDVWLHPYVFRLVCRNGAIVARTIQTRQLENLHLHDVEEATTMLREAIQACCEPDAFDLTTQQIVTSREMEADIALQLIPYLARFGSRLQPELVRQIMGRFTQDGDTSRYGLMNAVTSVARDTEDPEVRWNLEELGGAIPALVLRRTKMPRAKVRERGVLVG